MCTGNVCVVPRAGITEHFQAAPSSGLLQYSSPLRHNYLMPAQHFLHSFLSRHTIATEITECALMGKEIPRKHWISLTAFNHREHWGWEERENFAFCYYSLSLLPSTTMWAGPSAHTLHFSLFLFHLSPYSYTGCTIPWLLAILAPCSHFLPPASSGLHSPVCHLGHWNRELFHLHGMKKIP